MIRKIEQLKQIQFIILTENKAITLDKVIIDSSLIYLGDNKDGLYILGEFTCNGKCKLGNPLQECSEKNMFDKEKCSKYNLLNVEIKLNANDILKLMGVNNNG